MTILGIETATAVCGASVLRDGAIVSSMFVEASQIHSERLVPIIEEVVRDAGIAPAGLDAVAVSIGPGSFTGLRIGLSAAKGICFAHQRPIVAVPTLEAVAVRMADRTGGDAGGYLLPLLDARKGDVYAALYRWEHGVVVEVEPSQAMPYASLETFVGSRRPLAICADAGAAAGVTEIAAGLPGVRLVTDLLPMCHPSAVATVGARMVAAGVMADLASLEPLYVREFTTTAQKHHSIAE